MPLNLLHQMLNRWSAEQPPAIMWSLLTADAFLVGVLVAVAPAIAWRASRVVDQRDRRVAARATAAAGTAPTPAIA